MAIKLPNDYVAPDATSNEVLIGHDGNAFAIIATVGRALKRAGNDGGVIDAYRTEAMSGDYDHLLATSIAYLDGEA